MQETSRSTEISIDSDRISDTLTGTEDISITSTMVVESIILNNSEKLKPGREQSVNTIGDTTPNLTATPSAGILTEYTRSPTPHATFAPISASNAAKLIQVDSYQFSPWDIVTALAWSPNGNILAIAAGENIVLMDAESKNVFLTYKVGALTQSLDFDIVGYRLASGSRDGYLRVWDVPSISEINSEKQKALLTVEAHRKGVNSVAFSPLENIIASGGNDAVTRLWDVNSGENLGTMIGGTYAVPSFSFHPNGSLLAIINGDMIRLREIGSERILGTIIGENSLHSVAFSPDGKLIAAGDIENTIKVWNPDHAFRTGIEDYPKPIIEVFHEGKANSFQTLIWQILFSPDGSLLASAGGDGFIRFWEMPGSTPIAVLDSHDRSVTSIAFRHDGASFVSGGLDGKVIFWRVIR